MEIPGAQFSVIRGLSNFPRLLAAPSLISRSVVPMTVQKWKPLWIPSIDFLHSHTMDLKPSTSFSDQLCTSSCSLLDVRFPYSTSVMIRSMLGQWHVVHHRTEPLFLTTRAPFLFDCLFLLAVAFSWHIFFVSSQLRVLIFHICAQTTSRTILISIEVLESRDVGWQHEARSQATLTQLSQTSNIVPFIFHHDTIEIRYSRRHWSLTCVSTKRSFIAELLPLTSWTCPVCPWLDSIEISSQQLVRIFLTTEAAKTLECRCS